MKALLRDLLASGGRFDYGHRSMPDIRHQYGNRAVFQAVEQKLAIVVDNSLYLTHYGVDYIWKD